MGRVIVRYNDTDVTKKSLVYFASTDGKSHAYTLDESGIVQTNLPLGTARLVKVEHYTIGGNFHHDLQASFGPIEHTRLNYFGDALIDWHGPSFKASQLLLAFGAIGGAVLGTIDALTNDGNVTLSLTSNAQAAQQAFNSRFGTHMDLVSFAEPVAGSVATVSVAPPPAAAYQSTTYASPSSRSGTPSSAASPAVVRGAATVRVLGTSASNAPRTADSPAVMFPAAPPPSVPSGSVTSSVDSKPSSSAVGTPTAGVDPTAVRLLTQVEQRLRELEAARQQGKISEAEYATERSQLTSYADEIRRKHGP